MQKSSTLKLGLALAGAVIVGTAGIHQAAAQERIGAKELAANSVKSKHIVNGQVKTQDLHGKAKPAGAAYSEHTSDTVQNDLTENWLALRQFTFNAPSNGVVIANASVQLIFTNASVQYGVCTINDAVPGPGDFEPSMFQQGTSADSYHTVSVTRGLKVKAGDTEIYLLCKESAVGYDVKWTRPILTAIFAPDAYGATTSD